MGQKLQPAAILKRWAEYKKLCDEHVEEQRYQNEIVAVRRPKIYTMEGFCSFIDMEPGVFNALEKNKNYTYAAKHIKCAVLARKLEALVNGEGGTAGLIFDLKCNYGLHPRKKSIAEEDWVITMKLDDDEHNARLRREADERARAYAEKYGANYKGSPLPSHDETPAEPAAPAEPVKPVEPGAEIAVIADNDVVVDKTVLPPIYLNPKPRGMPGISII